MLSFVADLSSNRNRCSRLRGCEYDGRILALLPLGGMRWGMLLPCVGGRQRGACESTTDHVNYRMISLRLRRVQHFRLLRFADCRKYVTGSRATYQFVLESVIIKCSDRNSLRCTWLMMSLASA